VKEILLAILRIRKLILIERAARLASAEIDAFDERLNGTPPLYHDSRSPNGDDYNVILSITNDLKQALQGEQQCPK